MILSKATCWAGSPAICIHTQLPSLTHTEENRWLDPQHEYYYKNFMSHTQAVPTVSAYLNANLSDRATYRSNSHDHLKSNTCHACTQLTNIHTCIYPSLCEYNDMKWSHTSCGICFWTKHQQLDNVMTMPYKQGAAATREKCKHDSTASSSFLHFLLSSLNGSCPIPTPNFSKDQDSSSQRGTHHRL